MALTPLDDALIAKARDLYFQYIDLSIIVNATGITLQQLRPFIHGADENDQSSWFAQRRKYACEGFEEDAERNRFAAHQYAKVAMDFLMRSMNELSRKIDKRTGAIKSLTPFEMDAVASSLVKVDKLLRLTDGHPTEIIDHGIKVDASVQHEIIDMALVVQALAKDKSIRNRLMPAIQEEQENEIDGLIIETAIDGDGNNGTQFEIIDTIKSKVEYGNDGIAGEVNQSNGTSANGNRRNDGDGKRRKPSPRFAAPILGLQNANDEPSNGTNVHDKLSSKPNGIDAPNVPGGNGTIILGRGNAESPFADEFE